MRPAVLRNVGVVLGLALVVAGCAGGGASVTPAVEVDPATALQLQRRADGFYLRLAHRRFNTIETYNDRIMREHFRDVGLFLDYYADLAQALADAHFEKRRPLSIEVLSLDFEDATRARVRVRFVGDDRRPLRGWRTRLVREDRWVLDQGTWWIEPGKV